MLFAPTRFLNAHQQQHLTQCIQYCTIIPKLVTMYLCHFGKPNTNPHTHTQDTVHYITFLKTWVTLFSAHSYSQHFLCVTTFANQCAKNGRVNIRRFYVRWKREALLHEQNNSTYRDRHGSYMPHSQIVHNIVTFMLTTHFHHRRIYSGRDVWWLIIAHSIRLRCDVFFVYETLFCFHDWIMNI